MDGYDEDLNENPFFKSFLHSHVSLFSQCVIEQWIICVPRVNSLPKYAFTLEDFTQHILKPIEEDPCKSLSSSNSSLSGTSKEKKWNYETLAHVKVRHTGQTLVLELENSELSLSNNNDESKLEQSVSLESCPIQVLFEETFYTSEKKKYKVICIASPLNSKVKEGAEVELWTFTSLRDSIDFLWLKGRLRVLESIDAHTKLFLNNHRNLAHLPLPVQRDLVYSLYSTSLSLAVGAEHKNNDRIVLNFKIATETYVLNAIYKELINAITSALSTEDASLNKILRNLSEILPQDLEVDSAHWNNLTRARIEMNRISQYGSPIGKLNCLKKAFSYFQYSNFHDRETLSVDELLPIWVYLIVKTPLGNWIAQLEFLRNFRFSAAEEQDNENNFYIVTLEAALTHLKSGKVNGMAESERDVGVGLELGEAWLHALHDSTKVAADETQSPIHTMFNAIRQGNSGRFQELVENYEGERGESDAKLNTVEETEIDCENLCHPLCLCERCMSLVSPPPEEVQKEASVYLVSPEGLSLLHIACIYGRPKIVEYLISQHSPLDVQDGQGMTPMHYAASRGHQNALLLLLHNGADPALVDEVSNTPLHLASQNGHEGCVKALIYYAEHSGLPINVSKGNFRGDTPLHFASRWGFEGIVQILVEAGAVINVPNVRQITPIDCAHNVHVVNILQRSLRRRSFVQTNHGDFINVDVVRREEGDRTGLVMLISEPTELPSVGNDEEDEDCRESLNSRTSSSNPQSHRVSSPSSQTFDDDSQLIEKGSEWNFEKMRRISMSKKEETMKEITVESLEVLPAHLLAQNAAMGVKRRRSNRDRKITKLFNALSLEDVPLALHHLGIPCKELDVSFDGERVPLCHPLCVCTRCVGRSEGESLEIDVRNYEGLTPLHVAVMSGLSNLVPILYRYGADVNAKSKIENKTPMMFAKEMRHDDIVSLLESFGANG